MMIGTIQQKLRIGGAVLAAVAVAGSLLAACSSAGTATSSPGGLTVEGAWARTSTGMERAGAAYLVVKNGGSAADALVAASSPVSGMVQVHETYALPEPTGSAMPGASAGTGGTVMGMRPIARIDIPAGGSIELKPGGYHIMLMELKQELKAGDTIEITLTFEKAAPITVKAEVRES